MVRVGPVYLFSFHLPFFGLLVAADVNRIACRIECPALRH